MFTVLSYLSLLVKTTFMKTKNGSGKIFIFSKRLVLSDSIKFLGVFLNSLRIVLLSLALKVKILYVSICPHINKRRRLNVCSILRVAQEERTNYSLDQKQCFLRYFSIFDLDIHFSDDVQTVKLRHLVF